MGQIPGRLRTFACEHAHSTDREALTPVAAPRTQKTRKTPAPPKMKTPARCLDRTAARTPQTVKMAPPAPANGAAALLPVSKAASRGPGRRWPGGSRAAPCYQHEGYGYRQPIRDDGLYRMHASFTGKDRGDPVNGRGISSPVEHGLRDGAYRAATLL